MSGHNKGGASAKVNGLWFQLEHTPSGTYGKVYRTVTETWGREGDPWNKPRQVTVDKCVGTTRKFPAYHTDGATQAARQLRDHLAGTETCGQHTLDWLIGKV